MEKLTVDYTWQAYASCSEIDLEAFFPAQGKKYGEELIGVCSGCAVNTECYNHALKYEEYGYWAGTTPKQRDALRRTLGIEIVNISFYSQKNAQEDADKIEATRVKIKGRGRKPRNLQEKL